MYNLALFVHVFAVAVMAASISITLSFLEALRRASRVDSVSSWFAPAGVAEKLFSVAAVLFVITGGLMVEDRFSWSNAWVTVSFLGLIATVMSSIAIIRPRIGALRELAEQSQSGPLSSEFTTLALDSTLWSCAFAIAGVALGILFNMAIKPGIGGAVAAVLVPAFLGLLLGVALSRRRVAAP